MGTGFMETVFQAWQHAEIPEYGWALNRLAGSDPQGCIAGKKE